MDFKQEDDFWNQTSGNSFVFDDELDFAGDHIEDDVNNVFHSSFEVSTVLPIRAIISPKNLELVLEDVKVPIALELNPIEETLRKLCLGLNCSLEQYKAENDKLHLLDKAVETYDGNVILKVVAFLNKTLKPNIFIRHLAQRPVALQHYCNYLTNTNSTQELQLLHNATGNKYGMSNFFYISTQDTSENYIHKKLAQFELEHLDFLSDEFDKLTFKEHKKFMDYKMANNITESVPATAFVELCQRKLDNLSSSDPDIQNFLKIIKLSNFKTDWLMMNVIAANERWPMLNVIFQKEKWYKIKVSRKYNIPVELIVRNLYKHGAPRSILEDFLKAMVDSDHALYLGRKYNCYSFVIDSLIAKKDRTGLIEYRSSLHGDADWVRVVDKALLSLN